MKSKKVVAAITEKSSARGGAEPDGPGGPVGSPSPGARLSPVAAIVLAMASGLFAGYLDVGIIVLRKFAVNPEGYYRIGRDFPWSVPLVHAATMLILGLALALVGVLRRGRGVPLRVGVWLLSTMATWGAFLRLPIYAYCSLALAAGISRPIADAIAARAGDRRAWRTAGVGLLGALGVLAGLTVGLERLGEYRAVSRLPSPPRHRNVVLIVWDTVRADHLGLYGYERDTTPHLKRWADRGVHYVGAIAPAPWTFPSHCSFFTGRWPFQNDSQWKPRLDAADPTVAEYLASKGYQTAGFAANTNCCTYESGLDRGFAHYEDYSMSPASFLCRTVPGEVMVDVALTLVGDFNGRKWASLQSRSAAGINEAFLGWLGGRRTDRPFFAFLNYFDAHDAYMPPPGFLGRFGIRPRTPRDFDFLSSYVGVRKDNLAVRDVLMARDCYDDCVAYLDEQVGRLLDELERRGLLAETDVIITSDHGESFGEHGVFCHSYSARMEEIRVPLVMISPDAKAGKAIFQPVSLRDLPATIVERAGLSEGSPFPGNSLSGLWDLPVGRMPPKPTSTAFTEQANHSARVALRPQAGPGGIFPGFQMSLVAWGHHYIRDGEGAEQLYDLMGDMGERINLAGSPDQGPIIESFRALLLRTLDEGPGSTAVERTYLTDYRRKLDSQVRGGSPGRVAARPWAKADPAPASRPAS